MGVKENRTEIHLRLLIFFLSLQFTLSLGQEQEQTLIDKKTSVVGGNPFNKWPNQQEDVPYGSSSFESSSVQLQQEGRGSTKYNSNSIIRTNSSSESIHPSLNHRQRSINTNTAYDDREIRDKADPNINWQSPNPFSPSQNFPSNSEYYDPKIYGPRVDISSGNVNVNNNNDNRNNNRRVYGPQQQQPPLSFDNINDPRRTGAGGGYNRSNFPNNIGISGENSEIERIEGFNRNSQNNIQQSGNYINDKRNQNQGIDLLNTNNNNNNNNNNRNFPNQGNQQSYPNSVLNSQGIGVDTILNPNLPNNYPNTNNNIRNPNVPGGSVRHFPDNPNLGNSNDPTRSRGDDNFNRNFQPGSSGQNYPGSSNERNNYPGSNINNNNNRNFPPSNDQNYPRDNNPRNFEIDQRRYPGQNIPGQNTGDYPDSGRNYPSHATNSWQHPGYPHNPFPKSDYGPRSEFDPGYPNRNIWNEHWSTTTFRPLAPGVLGQWRQDLQGKQRPEDINQLPQAVYVTTSYGRVQGFKVKLYDGPGISPSFRPGITNVDKVKAVVSAFVGIPYARPPLDEGRFRPPRPHPGWTLHQAIEFGPACPQPSRYIGYTAGVRTVDEDCLYLNIFSPDIGSGVPGSPFPVIFYIHDGDFIHGASNQFPPHQLVAWYKLVVVTVNFRLGALGFLSTADEYSPGNYGMLDLQMALHWVHQNIRGFNGDPDRITLVGLGSGAGAAGLLMITPKTRHLIKNVIALEGAPTADWAAILDRYRVQNTTELFSFKMGCMHEWKTTSWQMVQCLRTRTWQELSNLELDPDVGTFPWSPVVDYSFKVPKDDTLNNWKEEDWHFLSDSPQNLIKGPNFPFIKYMTGFSRQSSADLLFTNVSLAPNYVVTRPWFDQMIARWVKKYNYTLNEEGVFNAIKYAYTYWPDPYNTTHLREEYIDFLSDALYRAPVDETVKLLLARGTQVHMYLLNYTLEGLRLPFWREVPRGLEYYLMTGAPFTDPEIFPERLRVDRSAWTEGDRNMSEFFMASIANMAYYGNPTPTEILGIFWERCLPNEIKYLALNGTNNSTIQRNYRQRELTFWSEYMPSVVGRYLPTYPPTTEYWWEPNEPLQIAFWTVSGICLMLIVILVAFCLLWRTAKKQRDRIYEDFGLENGPLALGTIVGDEISDYAGSVKTSDSIDSGVKVGQLHHHQYNPNPMSSQNMPLFSQQSRQPTPSMQLSASHLSNLSKDGRYPKDSYPKKARDRDTPQTQV